MSTLGTARTETFSEDSLPDFKGLKDLQAESIFFATGTEEAVDLDSEQQKRTEAATRVLTIDFEGKKTANRNTLFLHPLFTFTLKVLGIRLGSVF